MNAALRMVAGFMTAAVAVMVLWLVTPSAMFFNPLSLALAGDQMTLVRDTPFGDVRIDWIGEITLLNQDNYECGGSGRRIAQDEKSNAVTLKIGAWAKPCLDAGAPFVLRYQYQVRLFGLIPLRPTGISLVVEKVS